jgi:phosphoribosyl 1,2-cyclic phosphodiesterase
LEKKIIDLLVQIIKNPKFRGMKLKEIFEKIPFYLKSTYGGNTPCVLVKIKNSTLIFDAGSGIRELGLDLMAEEFSQGKGVALLFITHTHWDHVQGLPFFTPLFIPGNRVEFYSCMPDLKERLEDQQNSRFFPIDMNYMQSEKKFILFKDGEERNFGDFTVKSIQQNHPGTSHAYRVDAEGKSFVYSTDVEFNEKNYDEMVKFIEFFKGADVLTFDSQYTLSEAFSKIDWGHSSIQMGIDIANHSNVKKIVLFHYDPTYSDHKINEITKTGLSYKNTNYPDIQLDVIPSYEGLEIDL